MPLRKERPQLSLGSFLRRSSASAGPCRESQLFRDLFGRGARQLERFEAGLAVRLGETAARALSEVASRPQASTFWMIPMVIGFSKRRFCVAGIFLFLNSTRGFLAVWNCFGRDLSVCHAEQAYRLLYVVAVWRASTRAKPSAWDPPSLIVEQGLFGTISLEGYGGFVGLLRATISGS